MSLQAAEEPNPPATTEASGSPADAPRPTMAIWKAQELVLTYASSTSIFSCGALRSRVKSMLAAAGADSIDISATGCSEFLFPDDATLRSGAEIGRINRFSNRRRQSQLAVVKVRFRSPIEATPEALAELDKTKGYRELLGRVTGKSDAIQEAAAQFPAQRQVVTLSSRSIGFEAEECELIEQVARELYPKLGARVVKQNISCFPGQVSLLKPRLEVEALIRTPSPDASVQPPRDVLEPAKPQDVAKPEPAKPEAAKQDPPPPVSPTNAS